MNKSLRSITQSAGLAGLLAITACGGPGTGTTATDTKKPKPVTVANVSVTITDDDHPNNVTYMANDTMRIKIDGKLEFIYNPNNENVPKGIIKSVAVYPYDQNRTPLIFEGNNTDTITAEYTIPVRSDITQETGCIPSNIVDYTAAPEGGIEHFLNQYQTYPITIIPEQVYSISGFGDLKTNKDWYVQKLSTMPRGFDGKIESQQEISDIIDQITDGNLSNGEVKGRHYSFITGIGHDGKQRNSFILDITYDGTTTAGTIAYEPERKDEWELWDRAQ